MGRGESRMGNRLATRSFAACTRPARAELHLRSTVLPVGIARQERSVPAGPNGKAERTLRHGSVLERHQDARRSVRAYAARHLLCGKSDREIAAPHNQEGE